MFRLILLLLFTFNASLAQVTEIPVLKKVAIEGTVIDSISNTSLGYVSITVLEAGTNQELKTTFSNDNGSFRLSGLPGKPNLLVLTYVGYKIRIIKLPAFQTSELNLGIIRLSPSVVQLQEVQVQTESILVEQDAEKLTYHVEADPERHTLNALEMLAKVPLLSVDGNDNLQLNGAESYLVLINGKSSSLFVQNPSEVFRSMPANVIKSIEVISHPPARYDAEGVGGVINVITHRKNISGYNGSVNAGLTSPYGYMLGGYLTGKTGKLGFSANFGSNSASSPSTSNSFKRNNHIWQTQLQQTGESNNWYSSQFLSGELNYELSPLSLLSASYRLNLSEGDSYFNQHVELSEAQGLTTQAYRNLNNGRNNSSSSDIGLDFQHSFSKETEQLFTLSYKLSNSTNNSFSDFALQPLLNYTERISATENESSTREHTLQADYVQPIGKQTVELGLKSVFRLNSSDYAYRNLDPETREYLPDPRLSNKFDHRQDIHAAYASVNLSRDNWSFRLGARLDETFVLANFRTSGTAARQHYLNFIPSANLSRKLEGNSTIRFAYNQRLERPALYHLNPYVNETDPSNISYGNPSIDPAITHVFNLGYSTYVQKTFLNVGLTHQFTNNSIQSFTTLGEDTVARTTFRNIGRRQTYGLTLSGHTTYFKNLSLGLNTTSNYVNLTSTLQGRPQSNSGITLHASANASYRFPRTWRVNGNIAYSSPQVLLQGRSAGFISNSFSVNKEVIKKNKASMSVSVRNPFQKYRRFQSEVNDPDFYQLQESYSVIRQYSTSFTYRFGKVHAGVRRKKQVTGYEE